MYILQQMHIHMPTFKLILTRMLATIVYTDCMFYIFECILYPNVGGFYPLDMPEFDGVTGLEPILY